MVPKVVESEFGLVFNVFSVDEILLLVTEWFKLTGETVLMEGVCDLVRSLERAVSFNGARVRFL